MSLHSRFSTECDLLQKDVNNRTVTVGCSVAYLKEAPVLNKKNCKKWLKKDPVSDQFKLSLFNEYNSFKVEEFSRKGRGN